MNEYRAEAILRRAQNLLILHRAYKLLAMDTEWDESKHPRAENGRFGAGNGQERQPAIEKNRTESAIPEIRGNELGTWGSLKELRQKAKECAGRFAGKKFVNQDTGCEIIAAMSGIKHTIANAGEDLIKTVPYIPEIIRTAKLLHTAADKNGDPNILNIEIYRSTIRVEGRQRDVAMTVKHYRDGRRYYDHGFMSR